MPESAGSEPTGLAPEVVDAMHEVGLDIADRKPRKLLPEMQLHADWAVTMGCGDACPYVPTTVEDWDIPDPAGRPIEDVRAIRDAVHARVRDLVETKVDAIRSDTTAHRMRLPTPPPAWPRRRVRGPSLRPRTSGHAPTRSWPATTTSRSEVPHVLTLAHRQTRECLAKEHCDVLAAV